MPVRLLCDADRGFLRAFLLFDRVVGHERVQRINFVCDRCRCRRVCPVVSGAKRWDGAGVREAEGQLIVCTPRSGVDLPQYFGMRDAMKERKREGRGRGSDAWCL